LEGISGRTGLARWTAIAGTQGRGIARPAEPPSCPVVGNAVGARNNPTHRIVCSRATHHCAAQHGPRPNPMPPRGRGAVLNLGRATIYKGCRHAKAIAMLYRGIEYSIVQGIERHLWRWAVTGTKISGHGSTRDAAIENPKKALRAIQKQRFKQDTDGEDRNEL
jgi:hypothetical protein